MIRLRQGHIEIRTPFCTAAVSGIAVFLTLAAFTVLGGLLYFALQEIWAAVGCTLVALIVFCVMCIRLLPKPDDYEPPSGDSGSKIGSGPAPGGRQRTGRNSK